jgi:hypothetical protein
MKNVFFYVLFLITLIAFASGFALCLANINDMNDGEFAFGIFCIGFGIFTVFVLWKNNFFTRNK